MSKKERWSDIELKDRLMILATIGILAIAGFTGWIFVRQANVMQDQLDEMKGGGGQTERLLTLNAGQLTVAGRTAKAAAEQVKKIQKLSEATERLARQTGIANSLARQSLLVAQKSLELEQRPWMGVKQFTINQDVKEDTEFVASVMLNNTGKSPAVKMQTKIYLADNVCGGDLSSPILPQPLIRTPPTSILVMPGADQPSAEVKIKITKEAMPLLTMGQCGLFIYGEITYCDIFKHSHFQRFCGKWISGTPRQFTYCTNAFWTEGDESHPDEKSKECGK